MCYVSNTRCNSQYEFPIVHMGTTTNSAAFKNTNLFLTTVEVRKSEMGLLG